MPDALFLREASWWRKQRIQSYLECVLDHIVEQLGKHTTATLQTWIRIYFNQLWAEACVKHEVIAEELVGVESFVWIKQMECSSDGVCYHLLNLAHYVSFEINILIWEHLCQVFLEIGVA